MYPQLPFCKNFDFKIRRDNLKSYLFCFKEASENNEQIYTCIIDK